MAIVPKQEELIAMVTLRTVREGHQEEFETVLHEYIAASFHAKGQLGVHVIRPTPGTGSREYGIVRRFSSAEARDSFYQSKKFHEWEERIAPMVEGVAERQELSGLEAWFTPPGQGASQPQRWKMALATLLGVYPFSLLLSLAVHYLPAALHPLLQAFFTSLAMVSMLTWVVMPVLVKFLKPWLYPRKER